MVIPCVDFSVFPCPILLTNDCCLSGLTVVLDVSACEFSEAPARPLGGRGGDKPSPARPLNAEAIEKQRQVRLIVFATPISHVVCPVSAFNFRLRRCLPVSVGPLRLLRQPPVQASSELLLLLLPHLCKRLLVSALSL